MIDDSSEDSATRALIARAADGETAAMDRLLADHQPQVYRFALRLCGDEETAKEVLQETLLATFRKLGDFRGDAALSSWLYQIARRACQKQRIRKPCGDTTLDGELRDVPDGAILPDEQLHAQRVGIALAAAIAGLPPQHREVIVLRDVEGLRADVVAQRLGIAVAAVKSRLHRARTGVRRRISAVFDAERATPPDDYRRERLS